MSKTIKANKPVSNKVNNKKITLKEIYAQFINDWEILKLRYGTPCEADFNDLFEDYTLVLQKLDDVEETQPQEGVRVFKVGDNILTWTKLFPIKEYSGGGVVSYTGTFQRSVDNYLYETEL